MTLPSNAVANAVGRSVPGLEVPIVFEPANAVGRSVPGLPALIVFESPWILYWHARDNTEWNLSSYHKKAIIRNASDFWRLYNNLRTVAFDMFFLMREDHLPLWEAPNNVHGGALSFRIHNKEVDNFWLIASLLLVGETICNSPEEVVGLSVSPKLKNTTIRIWYRDESKLKDITDSLHPELLRISDDYIVRKHAE